MFKRLLAHGGFLMVMAVMLAFPASSANNSPDVSVVLASPAAGYMPYALKGDTVPDGVCVKVFATKTVPPGEAASHSINLAGLKVPTADEVANSRFYPVKQPPLCGS